jgi:hypothetical protein
MSTEHCGKMICKAWLNKTIPESCGANEIVDTKEPTSYVRIEKIVTAITGLLEYMH